MADAMCVYAKFLQLTGSDFPQRDDLIARKQFEKSFEHRKTRRSFGFVRHTITQHSVARIERMPRECVPQDELIWLEPEPQKRAPYNSCCRFGKAIWTFLRFARALRLIERRYNVWLSAEQQSLRSHRDSAEVTSAITNRFADQCQFFFSEPLLQISA